MKQLRKRYEELYNKKPFYGWDEEVLKEKIKQAEMDETSDEQPQGTENVEPEQVQVEDPPDSDLGDYKTKEDLKPPLPEGEKTDKEVIQELHNEEAPNPIPVEFTKETGDEIIGRLFAPLRDGRYRAVLRQIQDKEIKKKKEFVEELEYLKSKVYEGELKAVVQNYIYQLT